jgi:hypothetical protein
MEEEGDAYTIIVASSTISADLRLQYVELADREVR